MTNVEMSFNLQCRPVGHYESNEPLQIKVTTNAIKCSGRSTKYHRIRLNVKRFICLNC